MGTGVLPDMPAGGHGGMEGIDAEMAQLMARALKSSTGHFDDKGLRSLKEI